MSLSAQSKQPIRHGILANRRNKNKALFSEFNQPLKDLIEELAPKMVASYHPMEREPSTIEINELLRIQNKLALPQISTHNLIWKRPETMNPGPLGIMQPVGELVSPDEIELFICPALAVSKSGIRLGRGGGFYDRALEETSAYKVAVIFYEEFIDQLPAEAHDVEMDAVVTENGFFRL